MSEEDLQLLITLDDPWNAREWDTFTNRHAENTVAYWPGRGDPTIEQKPLSSSRPPLTSLLSQGSWASSSASFIGTMKDSLEQFADAGVRRSTSGLVVGSGSIIKA